MAQVLVLGVLHDVIEGCHRKTGAPIAGSVQLEIAEPGMVDEHSVDGAIVAWMQLHVRHGHTELGIASFLGR